MKHLLLVGLGGFLGSMGRYALSAWIGALHPSSSFPWGTFCVNVGGCLLIGLLYGLSERASFFTLELRYLLITGFLGGFTTFSAFSIETLNLWQRGDWMLGSAYAAGSVVLGVLATCGGLFLFRIL
jgi:CrcB protein